MSQEDIEVIRRGYEAWNRGDSKAVLRALDPEIDLKFPEGGLNTGIHHGHEQARKFIEGYFEAFERFLMEPERLVETGDRILVLLNTAARGRGSGVDVELRQAHVWTIRAGLATELEVFPGWEEALEALGLSP